MAASTIPVISAVGHETDWTLIDLVADARAPTPTKAAEWAVPKYSDLIEITGKLELRLSVAMRRALEAQRRDLKSAERGLPRVPRIWSRCRASGFDACANRLDQRFATRVQKPHTRFAQIAGRLPTVSAIPHHDSATAWRPPAHGSPVRSRATRRRIIRAMFASPRARALACSARGSTAPETGSNLPSGVLAMRLGRTASSRRARLERVSGRLQPAPLRHRVERCGERLDVLAARAQPGAPERYPPPSRLLDGQAKLLASLSYQSVLARGYALVRDAEGTP